MKRLLLGALLLATWTPALAVTLDPDCYRYYEIFNAEGLTYEEVGKVADRMHEKQCWPALQGLLDAEPPSAPELSPLPPITDCNSLVPHIVQMTVDQATEDNPAMMKLSLLGSMHSQEACVQYGMDHAVSNGTLSDPYGLAQYLGQACAGDDMVIRCVGTGRFPAGKELLHFYLERDSDGDEFIGYSSME